MITAPARYYGPALTPRLLSNSSPLPPVKRFPPFLRTEWRPSQIPSLAPRDVPPPKHFSTFHVRTASVACIASRKPEPNGLTQPAGDQPMTRYRILLVAFALAAVAAVAAFWPF